MCSAEHAPGLPHALTPAGDSLPGPCSCCWDEPVRSTYRALSPPFRRQLLLACINSQAAACAEARQGLRRTDRQNRGRVDSGVNAPGSRSFARTSRAAGRWCRSSRMARASAQAFRGGQVAGRVVGIAERGARAGRPGPLRPGRRPRHAGRDPPAAGIGDIPADRRGRCPGPTRRTRCPHRPRTRTVNHGIGTGYPRADGHAVDKHARYRFTRAGRARRVGGLAVR